MLEIGGTYEGWVTALNAILDDIGLTPADRAQIFAGTGCRAYGVALP